MICFAIGYALISTGVAPLPLTSCVPSGTPIQLMLLKGVSTASSKAGQVVPLVVTKDVVVDGRVVIAADTMAFAHVKQCRGEGALSASIFDKPARLTLTFDHLSDSDGNEIKLGPSPNKTGEFQLTREMTAPATHLDSSGYESVSADSGSQSVMGKVHSLFSDSATSISLKEGQVLLTHNVRLPIVQNAVQTGLIGQVIGMLRDIKAGRTLETLLSLTPATRPAMFVLRSVKDLGLVSANVGKYLSGRFKGRNIHCPAGVELTAYAGR